MPNTNWRQSSPSSVARFARLALSGYINPSNKPTSNSPDVSPGQSCRARLLLLQVKIVCPPVATYNDSNSTCTTFIQFFLCGGTGFQLALAVRSPGLRKICKNALTERLGG